MGSLMESSEITGEGEGCSSTESGWTIYLASPLNDDDDVHEVDDGGTNSDVSVEFHDSGGENRLEDDDSLASDASTGNVERNATTMDKNQGKHGGHDDYGSTDVGYSNHSTNVKEKFEKMERREQRRCFGGLFKRGGSSSGSSSKVWKTKLTW